MIKRGADVSPPQLLGPLRGEAAGARSTSLCPNTPPVCDPPPLLFRAPRREYCDLKGGQDSSLLAANGQDAAHRHRLPANGAR